MYLTQNTYFDQENRSLNFFNTFIYDGLIIPNLFWFQISGEATKGTVFTIDTDAVEGIFASDSKLDVRIVIRNLKEEAKDDDGESGVSEGED